MSVTQSKRFRAFTLVELLIVIAIIGIFTAVLFGSVSTSRGKARDVRRITDMKQVQLALALYFDVNRQYPAGTDMSALNVLVTQKYLPAIPVDPQAGGTYEYMTSSGNRRYCIGVRLEGAVPSDSVVCDSKPSGSVANYKAQK